MSFASGKYAIAICDRCGFQYKYLTLKKEWTGFRVCPECYEPKHPQLEPIHNVSDPEALYKPRPNNDLEIGEGVVYTNDSNTNSSMTADPIGSKILGYEMTASVGSVTITV